MSEYHVSRRARPIVLAHRGAHSVHPENSLAAFRAAFDAGADGIECDVQKASDSSYVMLHDPPSASFDEEKPPRLEEMLALLPPDAFLNLELKSDTLTPADCGPIGNALSLRPAPGPIMVSSFEPRLLSFFKARGFPIGLLLGQEAAGLGMAGMARMISGLRPDYVNLPIQMFEVLGKLRALGMTRLLRAFGFSLAFWTVNSREEVGLVRRFARIIITDNVERIRAAL